MRGIQLIMPIAKIERIGDTRRRTRTIRAGKYDLCKDGAFITLSSRCTIEATEVFRRSSATEVHDGVDPVDWHVKAFHHDTLCALPTLWQRFKAFVLCRDPPLPRAITINTRSS